MTDLWCEGVNDLGCKWFCELENKQDPDLSPWDGGGLPKWRFRREQGSVLIRTRRNLLITSCCGHNREGGQQWGEIFKSGWAPSLIMLPVPAKNRSEDRYYAHRALSNVNWRYLSKILVHDGEHTNNMAINAIRP